MKYRRRHTAPAPPSSGPPPWPPTRPSCRSCAALSQPVDKPSVLGAPAPSLRLASLAAPTNFTVLTKRAPAHTSPLNSDQYRPSTVTRTTSVADGDTLYDILERYGVSTTDAVAMARALTPVFEPQSLRKGQQLTLTLGTNANGQATPQSLVLGTARGEVEVARDEKQPVGLPVPARLLKASGTTGAASPASKAASTAQRANRVCRIR